MIVVYTTAIMYAMDIVCTCCIPILLASELGGDFFMSIFSLCRPAKHARQTFPFSL